MTTKTFTVSTVTGPHQVRASSFVPGPDFVQFMGDDGGICACYANWLSVVQEPAEAPAPAPAPAPEA